MKKIMMFSWFIISLSLQAMEQEQLLDTKELPLIPYNETNIWKMLDTLGKENFALNHDLNKNISKEEKNGIRVALSQGAILRGSILSLKYPKNQSAIKEHIQKLWAQLDKPEQIKVTTEMYGLADEYKNLDKNNYEKVVQAAHRKIENGKERK